MGHTNTFVIWQFSKTDFFVNFIIQKNWIFEKWLRLFLCTVSLMRENLRKLRDNLKLKNRAYENWKKAQVFDHRSNCTFTACPCETDTLWNSGRCSPCKERLVSSTPIPWLTWIHFTQLFKRFLTSVPKISIPSAEVYYYCTWYTYFRNRRYSSLNTDYETKIPLLTWILRCRWN